VVILVGRGIWGRVPVYCEEEVEGAIRNAFHYAFNDQAKRIPSGGVPQLEFRRIDPLGRFDVLGQEFLPLRLHHGRFRTLGFRVGDLAYCTDVSKIPDESWAHLEGLDTLILDALRYEPHPTHFHLAAALETIAKLKPRRAYLTHLSHGFDHDAVESALPPGVALAYDGLALSF
jgi:phosphoribosyl 1,2-cyclic phosphate phosphodiesterase